jgi:ufm1-conjugating enzyme 1
MADAGSGGGATAVALDERTRAKVAAIPLLTVNAGPSDDKAAWAARLKEELGALIRYIKANKEADADWFTITSDKDGRNWSGVCWTFHGGLRYETPFCFEIPVGYPAAPIEIRLPELDGKTPKMYVGARICLSIHFAPLWQRSAPKFGVAHALALGLGPWLAVEIPVLADNGAIKPR